MDGAKEIKPSNKSETSRETPAPQPELFELRIRPTINLPELVR